MRLNLFVSVCIALHAHISLISVHIACISYELPVACDADRRGGPPMHTGTDTGHARPDLGHKLSMHTYKRICMCMDRYRQIWTFLGNMYCMRWKIRTAIFNEWLGRLHGNGDVQGSTPGEDIWIFDFWGADRPSYFENGFKIKNLFFQKLGGFPLKLKFRDINRFAYI